MAVEDSRSWEREGVHTADSGEKPHRLPIHIQGGKLVVRIPAALAADEQPACTAYLHRMQQSTFSQIDWMIDVSEYPELPLWLAATLAALAEHHEANGRHIALVRQAAMPASHEKPRTVPSQAPTRHWNRPATGPQSSQKENVVNVSAPTHDLEQRVLEHIDMVYAVAFTLTGNAEDALALAGRAVATILEDDESPCSGTIKSRLLTMLRHIYIREFAPTRTVPLDTDLATVPAGS